QAPLRVERGHEDMGAYVRRAALGDHFIAKVARAFGFRPDIHPCAGIEMVILRVEVTESAVLVRPWFRDRQETLQRQRWARRVARQGGAGRGKGARRERRYEQAPDAPAQHVPKASKCHAEAMITAK